MKDRALTDPAHYDYLCPDDLAEMSCGDFENIQMLIVDCDSGLDSGEESNFGSDSESSADCIVSAADDKKTYPDSEDGGYSHSYE